MDTENLKKNFEEIQNLIHNFKEANDSTQNKNQELNNKIDKMTDDLTAKMEVYNTKIQALEAVANQPVVSEKEKNEKQIKEINENSHNFMKNGGHQTYNDYCNFNKIEKNAMSVDSDPDGGYLVLPTYDSIRKTREFETSPMRQLASIMTINSDRLVIPVDYDEASASRVGERGSRTDTDTPQIGQIEIPVHEMYAQQKVTQKLIDDIGMNIESWLSSKVADKFIRTENTEFVSGTTALEAQGFLTYSAWTTNTTASQVGIFEHGKIEQVNSTSAGAFTADGLLLIQNSLLEVYQANAHWMTKRHSFGQIMKLKDGEGNYLFNRALDMRVGKPFDLLGAPVLFANDMPTIASNALALAYGDFRAGYQIVDRKGVTLLRDPYTSKPYVIFYYTKRSGGAVVNFEAIKIQKLAA